MHAMHAHGPWLLEALAGLGRSKCQCAWTEKSIFLTLFLRKSRFVAVFATEKSICLFLWRQNRVCLLPEAEKSTVSCCDLLSHVCLGEFGTDDV